MIVKKSNPILMTCKGKMTAMKNGQFQFTPYAINSGSRYSHLYSTAHGEVKTTNKDVIICFKFPKKWNKWMIANALIHESDDVAEFIIEC